MPYCLSRVHSGLGDPPFPSSSVVDASPRLGSRVSGTGSRRAPQLQTGSREGGPAIPVQRCHPTHPVTTGSGFDGSWGTVPESRTDTGRVRRGSAPPVKGRREDPGWAGFGERTGRTGHTGRQGRETEGVPGRVPGSKTLAEEEWRSLVRRNRTQGGPEARGQGTESGRGRRS